MNTFQSYNYINIGEGSVETDKISSCREQSERSIKTSAGLSSFSTRREEQDEYLVKVTTLGLTLYDERVGFSGDDIDSTTLTSIFKGRVGATKDGSELTTWNSLLEGRVGLTADETESTTLTSLFKGRVGSTMDETELTIFSNSKESRDNLR